MPQKDFVEESMVLIHGTDTHKTVDRGDPPNPSDPSDPRNPGDPGNPSDPGYLAN